MSVKVAPSLLSADFSSLKEEIRRVESAGADMLHIDVMDGCFVPNITIGPVVVRCIRRVTKLPLDVHLMISKPQRFIREFVLAGSDMITMHIETISCPEFRRQAAYLKAQRIRVGVSLNPATPLSKIKGLLSCVDLVLVMSVDPGFSGQKFKPSVLPKIKRLRSIFDRDIAVDGGVNDLTAGGIIRAGANILAAGSYIFGAPDVFIAMERIRNAGK